MKLAELPVIIVGGATGGAAAALLLARAGAYVTLFERVPEPRAVGAGMGLADNGLAVLEALGLLPEIERCSLSVERAHIVDARRRTLLDPGASQPRVRMIRRSDLQEILLAAVAAEPRIVTRFGAAVTAVNSAGEVVAATADGPERHRAELVIGADGVHSQVRSVGAFGAKAGRPGISYVRSLVAAVSALGEEAWTPAGLFGSFAVPGGCYWYASAGSRSVRDALAAGDLAAFRAAWCAAYPACAPILAAVGSFAELIVQPVTRVDCATFVDGRLALVGDAAHAMAPNLGQGANSALVDTAVLLTELCRAADLATGLAAYDRRRRPAVRWVADQAGRLGALAELTHPLSRWGRDRLLLPVAERFANDRGVTRILQESREDLLATSSHLFG